MSQLHFSLLGEPLVQHDERTLTFSTRKALALLVYLAVEGGLHTRKTLSEAFWPELDAEHGRAALRATLLELRRLFERAHAPGEPGHLHSERDLLGVVQDDSLVLDLRIIASASKLVERGVGSIDGPGREVLLQQLEEAICLARGPFLAGFSLRDSQFFDDWSTGHREHWHRRVSQLFATLALLYEQGGEAERAIETVIRWLGFDPLAEEGYRRLMRLRFSQGDRVSALRVFSRCRNVLAAELQVEPEAETIALAKRIRHTAAPLLAPVQLSQSSAGQPPENLLEGPLLGRSEEFGILIERYQHVRAGQSQFVLLQGESGIGKTRLASEFMRWAMAQGAEILTGRALPTGRELAYQPLIDALRHQLEQDHAPADLGSPVWQAELARLLPDLRDHYPDLPTPATDEVLGRNRLFEAIAHLVQTCAAQHPLVLLLDDMQWADPATLDLLLYLAGRLSERPAQFLLLLNMNTDAVRCAGMHSTWLMALKRTGLPLTELHLTPFTQEETRRFVRALAWADQPVDVAGANATGGCPVSEHVSTSEEALLAFADWLHSQTQGQPLYLAETLKELMTRGILFSSLQESGAWGLVLRPDLLKHAPDSELIPHTLRELIRSQITLLSPSAWTLLVTASVLETELSFEHLCQVAGLEELDGLRALEELLSSSWLSERTISAQSQVGDSYVFRRELMREVVYQEAGATRRRVVQRRLAAIIRAGIADEQSEENGAPYVIPTGEHIQAEKRTGPGLPFIAGTHSNLTGSLWKTWKEDAIRTTLYNNKSHTGRKRSRVASW